MRDIRAAFDKNLGARLRVTMHLPKDPAKIDWKKAFKIWEGLKARYETDLSKINKNFADRKKLCGLQIDLS